LLGRRDAIRRDLIILRCARVVDNPQGRVGLGGIGDLARHDTITFATVGSHILVRGMITTAVNKYFDSLEEPTR